MPTQTINPTAEVQELAARLSRLAVALHEDEAKLTADDRTLLYVISLWTGRKLEPNREWAADTIADEAGASFVEALRSLLET